jgi:hypothetical protein
MAAILAERMRRQRIGNPLAADDDAEELIGAIQPISTGPFARPGSPPCLAPRTEFDDMRATDRLRRDRTLVKGRFQGGGIGYVLARDLGIYANAFRKPLREPSETQGRVLDALRNTGPLTPRQLKEETGLLNKQITYDVEDIALDLSPLRSKALTSETVEIVSVAYPEPRHRILRYAGRPL